MNDLQNVNKILVIQLGPIGDILLTTSYFEHLKNQFPGSELVYLIKKKYYKVVKNHPYIDDFLFLTEEEGWTYIWERLKMIKKIRQEKFDIVIDQQNKNSTRQLILFSGAPVKVGYEDASFACVYNVKAERGSEVYHAKRRLDMVRPLSIEKNDYSLYYPIEEDSREYVSSWLKQEGLKDIVVLSPGSPVAWKKWDINNYARAADLIAKELDLTPVWLWGPGEKADAKKGHNLMDEKSYLAPPTDLNQAAAFLEAAKLFICNDGGLNHLSVTTEVNTIALFGDTDPKNWSPAQEYETHHHLYNKQHNSQNDNSFGIQPKEVLNKAREILG